ncbi:hypothetical protein HWN40_07405 [Methanolobus zinderi]|uniref:Uncharacterized protein n=1 Tax=Methanolobus zinderi TaxID=536044 RepID=A0A7D5E841_9EURY|nr:hypothetical protein [Methanolobus zinderi]QLC50079.1 hypothetical protein HWN40_07405 [Methanolobus zinderi]
MIKRIIENWLTKTNEKGYQIPFCQYLISQKHTIVYISPHGPMEQGKDIISIDNNGEVYAFQLKGGNINLTEWRKIEGEISELIEVPVKHPSIDYSVFHKPFLVTNGEISDPVRVNIVDKNRRYEQLNLPKLEVITVSQLVSKFVDVHGSFLPVQPSDFRVFLELFLSEGTGPLKAELYVDFLKSILVIENAKKIELQRRIASSILLTQYALQPYETKNNYVSAIEGWTILCSYIFRLVDEFQIEEKYWKNSYEIILSKINDLLNLLKSEFLGRDNYIEGSSLGDGGLLYKSRLTIVLGWLSAFELFNKVVKDDYQIDNRVYDSIKALYPNNTWFWGESATPFFVMMSFLSWEVEDKQLANGIISNLILDITYGNAYDGIGTPDPYISLEKILAVNYNVSELDFDFKSFIGSSYHLEALVDILVRRNKREQLDILWKDISFIQKSKFIPEHIWDFFLWRCSKGSQVDSFYENPQSYSKLALEANNSDDQVPMILRHNFSLLYYLLMCFPHRLNHHSLKYIDVNFENKA